MRSELYFVQGTQNPESQALQTEVELGFNAERHRCFAANGGGCDGRFEIIRKRLNLWLCGKDMQCTKSQAHSSPSAHAKCDRGHGISRRGQWHGKRLARSYSRDDWFCTTPRSPQAGISVLVSANELLLEIAETEQSNGLLVRSVVQDFLPDPSQAVDDVNHC